MEEKFVAADPLIVSQTRSLTRQDNVFVLLNPRTVPQISEKLTLVLLDAQRRAIIRSMRRSS
ncbi:MAG: hypothetical protein ACLSA6_18395 [Holdemania massiliensis]